MASNAARNAQYVGKVLADGHLEIPKTIVAQLGLQQGDEVVAALTAVATEMLPQKQQRRVTHLLWKNQDGTITAQEAQELDTLVRAGQPAILRKARAIVALQRLGSDIIPDLEARVSNV